MSVNGYNPRFLRIPEEKTKFKYLFPRNIRNIWRDEDQYFDIIEEPEDQILHLTLSDF